MQLHSPWQFFTEYVEECFAKAQGAGGPYRAVNVVLGKLGFKSFYF